MLGQGRCGLQARRCLASREAAQQLHSCQRHRCTEQRHEQSGNTENAQVISRRSDEPAEQPPAEHGSADSNGDIQDDPVPIADSGAFARREAEQAADQNPDGDIDCIRLELRNCGKGSRILGLRLYADAPSLLA